VTTRPPKAYGGRILVQFEAKPTRSEGGLHLPLSQQVEPHWARVVSVGHLVRERIPVGCRAMVKQHMNGEPLEGTPYHWLTEDSVLGVEER
jgi:co-chaperonin GroES (HSP10)